MRDAQGPPSEADVIVLGCGVSGLTAAHELVKQGKQVIVLDDYDTPGGNHISRQIGNHTFDIGAIFFWSTSQMFQLFPEATASWIPMECPIGRITPDRRVLRYPIDVRAEVLSLPKAELAQIVADVAFHRLFHRKRESVRDFVLQRMGRRLFESTGLELYFERFCGRPADAIVYSFAERRMRWIKKRTSVTAILGERLSAFRKKFGPSEPPLQCYARPKDGFPAMYQPVVDRLARSGVRFVFSAGLASIERTKAGFEVHGTRGTYSARRVLSTIPLAITGRLAGLNDTPPPQSCSMTTLFCRFRGDRGFPFTVFYNFNRIGDWKRLTMHSDYYGKEGGWEYFAAEVTVTKGSPSPDMLFDSFRRSVAELGLFKGDLELLGSLETDFAYPILDPVSVENRDRLMSALAAMGIEGFGRQGAFDYVASSNLAIELAHAALNKADKSRAA